MTDFNDSQQKPVRKRREEIGAREFLVFNSKTAQLIRSVMARTERHAHRRAADAVGCSLFAVHVIDAAQVLGPDEEDVILRTA